MKKYLTGFIFLVLFISGVGTAQAQLTFVNNTACGLRVYGSYNYSSTPCATAYVCNAPSVFCPPFSTVTLPPGGGACLSPFPPPTAQFVKIGITTSTGVSTAVNFCTAPVTNYPDCAGVIRTLQMFSTTFAATF